MLVQKENTIGEVVAGNFHTAKIFEDFGLDFCCGGKKTIQDACRERGINPDAILSNLMVIEHVNGSVAHYDKWELDFLIDYIITNHHTYVLREITTIEHHMEKVMLKHGEKHPEIFKINSFFSELKDELIVHMQKEEKMLFPYIKNMVFASRNALDFPYPPFGTVTNPVAMMENEHENAGKLMSEINKVSNSYTPPDDACTTYRILYKELADFEADLHIHIHLENNLLFPKTIALEKSFSINN
ncbi:MAG TPA: iron-sulfur cluster repair di-iron protein [Ignavibacteria bacterium]|nr:iron-sulfur cluster repair di-iron protein [Ignavibacteria bacterium]